MPQVETKYGALDGLDRPGHLAFFGIPYALQSHYGPSTHPVSPPLAIRRTGS